MAVRSARKAIPIDPDSEIARLLKRVAEDPALLDVNGTRFRIESEDPELFASYDPARSGGARSCLWQP